MQCDFITVTDLLMNNMSSSVTMNYNNLLNMLFGSYLADTHLYAFERPVTSKLHSGKIRIDPALSEFYVNAERSVMCSDIKELLQYIFDKPNAYKELYELILYDDSLSVPMRKNVLGRVSAQYSDDTSLVNMIYEAVYIAVTRQYENSGSGYVALRYTSDISLIGDALFANSEYVSHCDHFCGRDAELDELHAMVQDNSSVIVTGMAGIGKSELVRAYAQIHKSEYSHFGYYFYKGSLKSIIANIISNPVIMDEDLRYRKNLELLSSLGESALLIIDSINITPEDDDCFDEILDAGCKVIFVSNYCYDDYCTYDLKEFRSADISLELIRKFYDYKPDERDALFSILTAVGNHTFCVYLHARVMGKGLYSPKTLAKKLRYDNGFWSIAERFAATKDKHSKKKTYYDHIRDLFHIMDIPERHRQILTMMIVAPYQGVRKDFMAKLMGLRSMVIIEDLIEVGLIQEYDNGKITLQTIIRELVKSELEPDSDNCAPLIGSIRAVCLNEALTMDIETDRMHDIIAVAIQKINFRPMDRYVPFLHDCYKFSDRFGISYYTSFLISQEKGLHNSRDAKQNTFVLSDEASFEMMQGNRDKAIELQEKAVRRSQECDDIMLQANTVNTYGYYLNLADRKEEALKAMQTGMALLSKLDDDGTFYFDKYRAIINYADLLFSLGQTDEAIRNVSSAEKSLQEYGLQNTEIFADCLYTLGLYHVCQNDTSAGNELVGAFHIFIDLYGRDSDFIQTRVAEVRGYIENAHNSIIQNDQLKQLLGE